MKKNRLSERILFSYKIFVNNVRENFIVAVLELSATLGSVAGSYTHLDVYKRQNYGRVDTATMCGSVYTPLVQKIASVS